MNAGAIQSYLLLGLGGPGPMAYTSPSASTIRLLTGLNPFIEEITSPELDATITAMLGPAQARVSARIGYNRFYASALDPGESSLFTLAVALYVKWIYLRTIATRKVTGTQEPLVMEEAAAIREEAAEAREEFEGLLAEIQATADEEAQPTPVALPFLVTDSPTVSFFPTPSRRIEIADERDNIRAGWEWQ